VKAISKLLDLLNKENYCRKYIKKIYRDSEIRFIYRTKFGFDIFVHPEKILDILTTNQACDAELWMHAVQKLIKSLDVTVDVGANIGITSCWFSRISRTVYAFEPDSDNIKYLKDNLCLNKIRNVEVVPCVAGNINSEVDFYLRQSFGHHSASKKHITKTKKSVRLPVVRLDDFLQKRGITSISLLKIDVEGSEIDVLKGVEWYIKSKHISLIVFEHAPVLFENNSQRIEVFDYLSKFGYRIFDVDHNMVERKKMFDMEQGDFYAKPV
jgi:FkbM family methyltransferase